MNASLQRDGTVEWAQPGVVEVVPGVYRIPLPLPNDGLKAVNVYAINTDEDVVLIDSGWAIAKARSLLTDALDALGRSLADVRRFLITHIHRDHYTQAIHIRCEFGTPVGLGIGEMAATAASDPLAQRPPNQPASRRNGRNHPHARSSHRLHRPLAHRPCLQGLP
jgi:glyoxylase-like metal-dependent hydrolase (beta-lactamase superfamily II)